MKRFNEPWFDDSKSSRQFGKWVIRLFFVLILIFALLAVAFVWLDFAIILTLIKGGAPLPY